MIRNDEIKNEIDDLKTQKEKIKQKDLIQRANKCKHDIQTYETIIFFGENVYTGKITIDEAKEEQSTLLEHMVEFTNKSSQKTIEVKEKNKNSCQYKYSLFKVVN